MLKNLPIMLCCTAPKNVPIMLNTPIMLVKLQTKQLSCNYLTPKTYSLSAPHSRVSDRVERVGFVPVSCSSFTVTFRQHRGSKLAKL